MIIGKLPYVSEDVDANGNVRTYFRRRGQRKIRIREKPGTPEFMVVYRQLVERSNTGQLAPDVDQGRLPEPGTFGWLCTAYFGSKDDFQRLDLKTQRKRRGILESILQEKIRPDSADTFADFPLRHMKPKVVLAIRNRKADLTEAANGRVKAIRRVYSWAIQNELADRNPARDIPPLNSGSTGHHTWTHEEIAQFEAHWPIGTKARLAMALMLYTGVRRSDAVVLGKQHVRQGWLKFTVHKNRKRKPVTVEIPILPVLQNVLDRSRTGDLTFLMTEYGKPFTIDGFGNWFRDRCHEAGLPRCSAHGLRKAGASFAAENGATTNQLMVMYGWLTAPMAERYTRDADRRRLAADAMGLLVRPKNETG
jgi:integrase